MKWGKVNAAGVVHGMSAFGQGLLVFRDRLAICGRIVNYTGARDGLPRRGRDWAERLCQSCRRSWPCVQDHWTGKKE